MTEAVFLFMPTDVRPACEIMVNKILPRLRGEIAKILSSKYGMRQTDIAEILGLTQASVSQYLSSNRGQDKLLHEMFPEIEEYASEAAKRIVEGIVKLKKKFRSQGILCKVCSDIRVDDKFSAYLDELCRPKGIKICGVVLSD